jgi:hypothetical protein
MRSGTCSSRQDARPGLRLCAKQETLPLLLNQFPHKPTAIFPLTRGLLTLRLPLPRLGLLGNLARRGLFADEDQQRRRSHVRRRNLSWRRGDGLRGLQEKSDADRPAFRQGEFGEFRAERRRHPSGGITPKRPSMIADFNSVADFLQYKGISRSLRG